MTETGVPALGSRDQKSPRELARELSDTGKKLLIALGKRAAQSATEKARLIKEKPYVKPCFDAFDAYNKRINAIKNPYLQKAARMAPAVFLGGALAWTGVGPAAMLVNALGSTGVFLAGGALAGARSELTKKVRDKAGTIATKVSKRVVSESTRNRAHEWAERNPGWAAFLKGAGKTTVGIGIGLGLSLGLGYGGRWLRSNASWPSFSSSASAQGIPKEMQDALDRAKKAGDALNKGLQDMSEQPTPPEQSVPQAPEDVFAHVDEYLRQVKAKQEGGIFEEIFNMGRTPERLGLFIELMQQSEGRESVLRSLIDELSSDDITNNEAKLEEIRTVIKREEEFQAECEEAIQAAQAASKKIADSQKTPFMIVEEEAEADTLRAKNDRAVERYKTHGPPRGPIVPGVTADGPITFSTTEAGRPVQIAPGITVDGSGPITYQHTTTEVKPVMSEQEKLWRDINQAERVGPSPFEQGSLDAEDKNTLKKYLEEQARAQEEAYVAARDEAHRADYEQVAEEERKRLAETRDVVVTPAQPEVEAEARRIAVRETAQRLHSFYNSDDFIDAYNDRGIHGAIDQMLLNKDTPLGRIRENFGLDERLDRGTGQQLNLAIQQVISENPHLRQIFDSSSRSWLRPSSWFRSLPEVDSGGALRHMFNEALSDPEFQEQLQKKIDSSPAFRALRERLRGRGGSAAVIEVLRQ